MANVRTMATATLAAAGVIAMCGAALGQSSPSGRSPSQSDFDACNREAQLGRGGSASPSTAPGSSVAGSAGTGIAGSGATDPRASGAGSTGAGSAAGATGATGSVSGGSTLRSGAESTPGDPGLRGIATSAQTDPAYQQAYRDCLRRRGF